MKSKLLAAKSGAINLLYAAKQLLELASGTSQFVSPNTPTPDSLIVIWAKILGQRVGEYSRVTAKLIDQINAANCNSPIVSIAGVSSETAHSAAGKIGNLIYHACRNSVIDHYRKSSYEDIREAGGPGWEELLPKCWEEAKKSLNGATIEETLLAQIEKEWRLVMLREGNSSEQEVNKQKSTRQPSVNARMIDKMQKDPESRNWSTRQWAEALGCSKSAVGETSTWQSLKVVHADAKISRLKKQTGRKRR